MERIIPMEILMKSQYDLPITSLDWLENPVD